MKHAGSDALDTLEGLLQQLRAVGGLKEVKRGVFYRRSLESRADARALNSVKSKAFLHFHEDPKGLFADLLQDGKRTRVPVTTDADQAAFLEEVARRLATK